jgi:hypothetical protein
LHRFSSNDGFALFEAVEKSAEAVVLEKRLFAMRKNFLFSMYFTQKEALLLLLSESR